MRNPLPKNRLVALALLGAVATAIVTLAVVIPGILGPDLAGADETQSQPAADSPQPNEDFTPAVQTSGNGGHEEHEDEEHEREEEGHEREEYDD